MELAPYLRLMVQRNGSDLYFSTGTTPHVKINGQTVAIGEQKLVTGDVSKLAYSVMSDDQIREFEGTMECNLAISIASLGRFRVNVFRQRGDAAMVIRFIKGQIPSIEELYLPQTLKKHHHGETRPDPGRRIHRLGKIDHPRLDDRLP